MKLSPGMGSWRLCLLLCVVVHSGKGVLVGDKSVDPTARAPWNATYTDTLKRSLLAGYDKFARPAHHQVATNVTIALTVNHVELDDINAVVTLHGWMKMAWNDDKLQWNASEYGGLHSLHVADHEIWQPDVVQYNSASGSVMDQYGNTHCIVGSEGTVLWVPPTRLNTFCALDLRRWPEDEHSCLFSFGSWTYDGMQINLFADSIYGEDNINSDYYIENTEWQLLNVSYVRLEKMYACCEDAPYIQVDYTVRVRRRGAGRATLLRLQAAAAGVLSLLGHCMPAGSAGAPPARALLAAVPPTLLAATLFYLGHRLPATHYTPDIVVIYTGSLYLVLVSAVVSVMVLNVARGRRPLPWPLKRALSCRAARMLGAPPLHAAHDSTSEELQAAGGCSGDAEGSPAAPPPSRAWLALATLLDRLALLLLFIAFMLLFIIYGC